MQETCGNIKAILARMQGSGLSSTAKLVAILEVCGVTDRSEIERLLEVQPSTIRQARQALKIQRQKSSAVDASARIPAPEIQRCDGNPAQAPEIQRQNSSDRQNSSVGTDLAPPRGYKESSISPYLEVKKIDSPFIPPAVENSPPEAPATSPRKPSPNAKRGSRLDREWELPADWRMWARTNFCGSTDEQITEQAAQFHDYWISKPGAMACKLDWEATWRNWCRKGLSPLGGNRRPQSTGVWGRPRIDLDKLTDWSSQEPAL
jgi:hypothetical protein